MAKTAKVTSTLDDAHGVKSVWESIPRFKMGSITLEDFNTMYAAAEDLNKVYASKEVELTGIRSSRDDKVRELSDLITRFRSGMRSVYGPDSVQYEQSGATRASARKKPVRNHNPASGTASQTK